MAICKNRTEALFLFVRSNHKTIILHIVIIWHCGPSCNDGCLSVWSNTQTSISRKHFYMINASVSSVLLPLAEEQISRTKFHLSNILFGIAALNSLLLFNKSHRCLYNNRTRNHYVWAFPPQ